MAFRVEHLNPAGMPSNPAFSQAVVVRGAGTTIYVGGQNGVAADGSVVGEGDLAAQTEQVFRNLEMVLAAAGATLHDIVQWTIYTLQGLDPRPAIEVFQWAWGTSAPPPAISVVAVASFIRPQILVEIAAVAVVADEAG